MYSNLSRDMLNHDLRSLSPVSIAMGADYSFYVKTIETHAGAFLTLNILAIGRVGRRTLKICTFQNYSVDG